MTRLACLLLVACPVTVRAGTALELSAGGGALSLSVDPSSLAYTVSVGSEPWFDSLGATGGYGFSANGTTVTLAKQSLTLIGAPSLRNGTDSAGRYTSLSLSFALSRRRAHGADDADDADWVAVFKAYEERPAIAFAQRWPKAAPSAKGGSTFPSLRQTPASASRLQLGTLEYTGSSCGFMVGAQGEFPGITGGNTKGYVVIAPRDASGTGMPASLTIGPVKEHFANQARNDDAACLAYGLAASFEAVPAGFELETVLVASLAASPGTSATSAAPASPARASIARGGVNDALMEYGDFVLARNNKSRASGQHNTETTYLGYSTTGYYFYNLCDCLDEPPATPVSGGKPDAHNRRACKRSPIPARFLAEAATPGVCASYADTLIAVNAALREQGIPIKHFLLDSWWYGEGWNGGASLWEDAPQCTGNDTSLEPAAYPASTFPAGLRAFHAAVGLDKTLWAHNGVWTQDSPYRRQYSFADGEAKGPPQGAALWKHLFESNRAWGLSTIKQDHIRQQVGMTASAYTNVSVLKSWMAGMGQAAGEAGVGVMYCCAEPNIHMNGVTVPSAYAVRSSPDYVGNGQTLRLPTIQWAIGPDAAFHWNGLGLLPYKDTFISNSTSTQKSGRRWSQDPENWPSFSGYHELGAATHALMALLSMAHVTVSDAVGETNATLVRQLIRADGVLLKADRPATALDAQFHAMLFGAWPGSNPGPGAEPGSLFTMPCDTHNAQQRWVFRCVANSSRCALQLDARGDNNGSARPENHCLAAGPNAGCGAAAAAGTAVAVGDAAVPCATNASCPGQQWQLTSNTAGPRGMRQWALQAAGPVAGDSGESLCFELRDNGGVLTECDTTVAAQGWLLQGQKDPRAGTFSLATTWHDDTSCLTASKDFGSGAFRGFGAAEGTARSAAARLADTLFPRGADPAADRHRMTDQYRDSYAVSAALLAQIDARNAQAQALSRSQARARGGQCKGGFGAPQGPLGEVYSTHTTVSQLTWRYIVGVQLPSAFNVSARDLALPPEEATQFVSYRYDAAEPGFAPRAASELRQATREVVVALEASSNDFCTIYPGSEQAGGGDAPVRTRCFPFQLHAVAPVASNGWVLLGETGKFLPVSRQRIESVTTLAAGGFELALVGAPGERVRMGAANHQGAGAPVYATATIGADGSAKLTLPEQ